MSENSDYHGDGSSLSIEETNKLRIQLGLKPLESNDVNNENDTEIKRTDNFVHTPAINIGDIKRKEKLENNLKMHREERERKEKLLSEKALGLDYNLSNDEFLKKVLQKKIENEAKSQTKVENESSDEELSDKPMYKRDELSGIAIEHKASRFDDAGITILTLKDKNILDEENDDVLINVNLLDREREEKNLRNKKMGAFGAYVDSGDEDDPLTLLKPPSVLSKYDEVIDGVKRNRFMLDSKGKYNMEQERAEDIYRKSFFSGTKQSINTEPRIASDYLSPVEIKQKLKPKKRKAGGVRTVQPKPPKKDSSESESKKSKKEDGELAEDEIGKKATKGRIAMDFSSDEEDNRPPIVLTELDSTAVNLELKRQLSMLKKSKAKVEGVAKMEVDEIKTESDSKKLVFSNTEEFTKSIFSTLVAKRKMDAEVAAQVKEEPITKPTPPVPKKIEIKEEPVQSSGWQPEEKILSQPAQIPSKKKSNYREQPVAPKKKEKLKLTDGILGDEVQINSGIYSTLLLVKNKGYLEDKKSQPLISNPKNKMLRAQYFQEEKIRYDDIDQKCPRRDRRNLPEMPFIDKTTFDPEIKLEYHDDQGRPQPPKEAFRALSHRFHGKTSGKIKSAKRLKKMAEQAKINTLGDTDQKLMKMQSKMKSENRFCVPLSGKNSIIPAALKKSEKK